MKRLIPWLIVAEVVVLHVYEERVVIRRSFLDSPGVQHDADESAHYEFVCKAAGIPVHYCAEVFSNDASLPSSIMKALKRAMAGEYSRELGVKVVEGQKRMAARGFKQGGSPAFGYQRLLVSSDRQPRQLLQRGERK